MPRHRAGLVTVARDRLPACADALAPHRPNAPRGLCRVLGGLRRRARRIQTDAIDSQRPPRGPRRPYESVRGGRSPRQADRQRVFVALHTVVRPSRSPVANPTVRRVSTVGRQPVAACRLAGPCPSLTSMRGISTEAPQWRRTSESFKVIGSAFVPVTAPPKQPRGLPG